MHFNHWLFRLVKLKKDQFSSLFHMSFSLLSCYSSTHFQNFFTFASKTMWKCLGYWGLHLNPVAPSKKMEGFLVSSWCFEGKHNLLLLRTFFFLSLKPFSLWQIGPFETTSAELRELRPGRPYLVQVCAQELLGLGECSEWSEAVNVTLPKVKLWRHPPSLQAPRCIFTPCAVLCNTWDRMFHYIWSIY